MAREGMLSTSRITAVYLDELWPSERHPAKHANRYRERALWRREAIQELDEAAWDVPAQP